MKHNNVELLILGKRVIFIVGEMGSGKTKLASEIANLIYSPEEIAYGHTSVNFNAPYTEKTKVVLVEVENTSRVKTLYDRVRKVLENDTAIMKRRGREPIEIPMPQHILCCQSLCLDMQEFGNHAKDIFVISVR